MGTLTGLSEEYVTFDRSGQGCGCGSFGFSAASLPNWRFRRNKSVIRTIEQIVRAEGFGNS